MGCSNSKLHNLPAVSLCRDRCKFLAEALHHIHSLSGAHVAFLQSMDSLGSSLHRFLDQTPIDRHHNGGGGEDLKATPAATAADRTSSSSSSLGSHIHFDTDSEDDNASKESSNYNNLNHFEEQRQVMEPHNFYECSTAFTGSDMGRNRIVFQSPSTSPPPPPPAAGGLGWDILNLFDAYDRSHLHLESTACEVPVTTEEKPRQKKDESAELKREKDSSESAAEKKTKVNEDKEKLVVKEPETAGSDTSRAVVDIGGEIQSLFEEAALSGRGVLMLLDAGKLRYLHNRGVTKEPISVAVSVGEEEEDGGSCDGVCGGGDLSSTLTKLSLWEKKLYHEVKAEGKLRILYTQKWREMKHLQSSSHAAAEAKKVESVRNLIVTLSAKLKISFHVIDKVSMTLTSLRDEELWPWIHKLIHGFHGMWQTMLKCHRSQHNLMEEFLKTLDGDSIKPEWSFLHGNRHLEETMRLRSDLHSWTLSFCSWINTQKRFIKALNGWLSRFLEPQGEASEASSIVAPSVFVICSQWSKSLEMVSVKEVTESSNGLLRAMEQHSAELMLQRAIAADSREAMKVEKKVLSLSSCGRRNAVRSDANNASVQCCLTCTFEAMEKLSSSSVRIFEELRVQAEKIA